MTALGLPYALASIWFRLPLAEMTGFSGALDRLAGQSPNCLLISFRGFRPGLSGRFKSFLCARRNLSYIHLLPCFVR